MCGIAGIIPAPSHTWPEDLPARILNRLRHRGPDDSGWLAWEKETGVSRKESGDRSQETGANSQFAIRNSHLLLLHTRLSILDLSPAGHQPMSTADGRFHLVYNGEIYNHLELRAELEATGESFTSTCDTEVLLKALARWGTAALERLNGMFALALLDVRRGRLLLARDFAGIKPLYWAAGEWGCAFASELKALLEVPHLARAINPERLYLYLRYGLTDHGSETMLEGVHQVPAGHWLEIDVERRRVGEPVAWWQPSAGPAVELSAEAAAGRLRELLLESVRLHLRSDVPVGAALSGGLDSSTIVAAMRHATGPSLDLHAIGYVADDPAINEERWIDLAAGAVGATVHKTRLGAADLAAGLDGLIDVQDEPFAGTSIFAQHCVFRAAAGAGLKVMLDGQGADELLAGYRPYLAARLATLIRAGRLGAAAGLVMRMRGLPQSEGWRPLLRAFGLLLPGRLRDRLRAGAGESLFPGWMRRGWFGERGVAPTSLDAGRGPDRLRRALLDTFTRTSLPMLLRYEDRNSMAFSIESRVPFVSRPVVEFCQALGEEHFISPDGSGKAVLRRAMRGIVPDAILDRRDKIGFATPQASWLGHLRPWVEATLTGPAAAALPMIDLAVVRRGWERSASFAQVSGPLWRVLNLTRWAEQRHISVA